MNPVLKKVILITFLAMFLAAPCYRPAAHAKPDPFPIYTSIQPNVSFWINIFTEFSSENAVIHDNREMNRIYDVIALVGSGHHNSRKINRLRIKKSKEKYQAILEKLMRGKAPDGSQEQRVAQLFGPYAKPEDFRVAARNIRGQTGLKDRFREGIIRSGAYLEEIKQIFRDEGLPEDLAYLPHVESSFNPSAFSKSAAVGTWQFTRSTGKLFMEVGDVVDERRDPMLSTHAAAKLLRKNYLKLENWPMAITAYNHGAAGMARAKKLHGSYEAIFKNYKSRLFRFASRNFYSEFLAAREVANNYRKYFGDLKLDSPRRDREIVLAGFVSLPELARHLKLNLAKLRKINPALGQPVYHDKKYVPKGYPLRLPGDDSQNWGKTFSMLPDKLFRQKQKPSRFHIVRKGDTAGKIARRHRVNLDTLIAVNNLDARARIYINQKIRIPLPANRSVQMAKN